MQLFTQKSHPFVPLVEAISACEKAEKWQHALALLADLASRPSMGSMQPWFRSGRLNSSYQGYIQNPQKCYVVNVNN